MAESHEIWDGLDVYQPSVDFVDVPEGVTPIESKWVFKKKIRADGQVKNLQS